jgi:DNA primase
MARIPNESLERLKREVSLARLIEAQGLKLISQGKDLACRCPWHEGDDTPSCIVSPKTNLWHCFGCDPGGSVIDWVMRRHKVSFRHARELLAKQHPALAAAASTDTPAAAVKLSAGKLRERGRAIHGECPILRGSVSINRSTKSRVPRQIAFHSASTVLPGWVMR